MSQSELPAALREQAKWCSRLGSPLYSGLLEHLAEDVEASGPSWRVLEPVADVPKRLLLPLRFLAGVHRMALEGNLAGAARYYPSCGGVADVDGAWSALRAALEDRGDEIRDHIAARIQTNEVNRCRALAPGFAEVVRRTGLPLSLLEIGCSAGLNLRWDKFGYEAQPVEIVERRGCDLNPIDPTSPSGRVSLLSFIWPDQLQRFDQLSNAIDIARSVPAVIEQADAVDWMERQLAVRRQGVATVLFHSVVLLYLENSARRRVELLMNEAGERAAADAPVAWLSMEPGAGEADVHLTIWPGGERKLIAKAGYHGNNVELVQGESAVDFAR